MSTKEGDRVKELLDEKGLSVQDLARAAGVQWSAAKKYVTAEVINPNAWETCARALDSLGIDPNRVKPAPSVHGHRRQTQDLKPFVGDFSRHQLENLKKILEADQYSRDRLIDFIDGYLAATPSRRS